MSDGLVQSAAFMGTVVTLEVVGHGGTERERVARGSAVERAMQWFRHVEERCTRFADTSEVCALAARAGEAVQVSEVVFQAVQFAIALAEETNGAFDPAIGRELDARGFNRERRPRGEHVRERVSYRDVKLDREQRSITLNRPLLLDLGAVAKGLAIDLAARELIPFRNFAIDAGGDLYLAGHNAHGEAWRVGIRHPREEDGLLDTLEVTDAAVCTSGDYEPQGRAPGGGHHLIDARVAQPATGLASVTVIAPTALVADALGTAAFVLGAADGVALLQRHGVRGILVTSALERIETQA